MRAEQIKQYLVNYYFTAFPKIRYAIMLLGAPGIGKSTAVREAAEEIARRMNKEFIDYDDDLAPKILASPEKYFVFVDFRLSEVEPSDLIGLPREVNGAVQYKPLLWARVLNKTAGVLFLDELTNVQRLDVISAAYKLIYDRKAGFVKFSPDVLIVAAGNRSEESKAALELPTALINRMIVIECDVPKIEEWANWMDKRFGENWDRRTLAFLMRFSDDFLRLPDTPETLENFPTPRTWTVLAVMLAAQKRLPTDIIAGLVGKEVATRFSAFLRSQVPSVKELITKPQIFNSLNLDGKYIAVVQVANFIRKNTKNLQQALNFVKFLAKESREFLVLLILSCGNQKYKVLAEIIDIAPEIVDAFKDIAELKQKLA